jgi:rRNA maturation protein Rpf1
MSKREIEYLKRLNRILENENKILREKMVISESVVETLFSHAKEIEK